MIGDSKVVDKTDIVDKISKTEVPTLRARLAFPELRQAFSIARILHHFDLECHIWIKTNASGNMIDEIFS